MANSTIAELLPHELPAFLGYMEHAMTENGQGAAGYFQPQALGESFLTPERTQAIQAGLALPVGSLGWRRFWAVRNSAGEFAAHVDLRALPDKHTQHRCLLGLGVDPAHRRQGLARQLMLHAIQWATAQASLNWIDLRALSHNQAALALYRELGFAQVGEIPDMFRLDGHSFGDTLMVLRLK